jgi:hypothetical protein
MVELMRIRFKIACWLLGIEDKCALCGARTKVISIVPMCPKHIDLAPHIGKSNLVMSQVRKCGSSGLAVYFEKAVHEKKGFPFKLDDKVLMKIEKNGIVIKRIDERLLERLVE